MTIEEVQLELQNSDVPVAKALHKDHNFKVLIMGFKAGMVTPEHTTKFTAKITVLEGKIIYRGINDSLAELGKYSDFSIPVGVPHTFEAVEDSLCLLTQSWDEEIVHTAPGTNFIY